ncbi:MAG: tyrosine-type recombinase/integrase, partial [Chlorobiales bacterium]|nr:tyrosine-type recombinase/integrase [Chlorobiales bacterium]
LEAWGKAAGLPFKLTFHVGRHTFISLGIAAGVPIKILSGLAGHATVNMTETYVHLLNPAKIAGVDALPVIGGASERERKAENQ